MESKSHYSNLKHSYQRKVEKHINGKASNYFIAKTVHNFYVEKHYEGDLLNFMKAKLTIGSIVTQSLLKTC